MTSRILHVSGDIPDSVAPFKTPVVKSLLGLTSDTFDHHAVSLNRVSPGLGEFAYSLIKQTSIVRNEQTFEEGLALEYLAPSRGIFHRTMLERLGEYLADYISSHVDSVELLVGHKLTIEGIAVAKAAKLTGIPYAITIQGNTDRRILKARPDLISIFREIYLGARTVCTFTPIARNAIEQTLGKRQDGIELIPCPTELDTIREPKVTGGDVLSVFHLKNYAVKNLKGLAKAATLLDKPAADRRILIVGGGDEDEVARCKEITAQADQIAFAGAVKRSAMQELMNNASALVVPSNSESFGLVFVEALFAGLPIIYPKNTAIDGYFDGLSFAQRVDASSPEEIAAAMERAVCQETEMKRALGEWLRSGAANFFTREAIGQKYTATLQRALTGTRVT